MNFSRPALISVTIFVAGCVAPDKQLHLVAGAGISVVVTSITNDPAAGCAAAIFAGIAKEAYDSFTHAPDAGDILATGFGGCMVSIAF